MHFLFPLTGLALATSAFGASQLKPFFSPNNDHEFMKRAQSFPFCQGPKYGITTSNCAKFQFNPNDITNCIEPKNCTTFYDISNFKTKTWSPQIIKFAELINNEFENGNSILGFAACEAEADGRGYTVGYVGFTTGTNDANSVIQEYIHRKPKANAFSKYSKELERLSKLPWCGKRDARNDTSHLVDFL